MSAQTNSAQISRVQLGVVVVGYVGVLLSTAALVYMRYLQYTLHAADADASGGMWDFGDLLLELFIAGLFWIPTLVLGFFLRKSEAASTRYSQVLLSLALITPISAGVMAIPAVGQANSGFLGSLGWCCLGWFSASPVFLGGFFLSWIIARFRRAKRLLMYALWIELGTYTLLLAAVLIPWTKR